jgi:hypothetical protein
MCLCALLVAGCSSGQMFTRPSADSLTLNATTYQDVLSTYGPATRQGTQGRNQRVVKSLFYSYTEGRIRGNAHEAGVTPTKSLEFFFLDDVLVAYGFSSAFKDDHTDYDQLKANRITRGETTRDAVIALLGPPSGMSVYPWSKNPGERSLVYLYGHSRLSAGITQTYWKVLPSRWMATES